jgi:hypothetical protein
MRYRQRPLLRAETERYRSHEDQSMVRHTPYCDLAGLSRARESLPQAIVNFACGLIVLLVGLIGPLGGRPVSGQTVIDPRQEYNVKAVYLYSFGRYVVWPKSAVPDGKPFTIGILGSDPFAGALDRIAQKKKIAGKRIAIRRFASVADYQPCHILFLSRSVTADEQAAVVKKMGRQAVLLAAETAGFAARGGTINFFLSDGTVRFEINVDAAKRQGLSIDAKLLSLAKLVRSS